MKANDYLLLLVYLGMLCVLAGLVIPFISQPDNLPRESTFRYIYAAGAAMTLIGRAFTRREQGSMRLRRLLRIESWSALFFCVAAFLLFYDRYDFRNPVAFTMAGALIQLYTSVMIPRQRAKDNAQTTDSPPGKKTRNKTHSD